MDVKREDVEAHIIWKLHVKRMWGGKHTALENVRKGIPKHLGGQYIDVAKDLIRKGFLLSKPTSYGLQISLNPDKKETILKTAEEFATKYKKYLI